MSKKNERMNKIKKRRQRQKRNNKNPKKSTTSNKPSKDNIISQKITFLKAKKNQLRCHYCKLLMLRTNYSRHLKTQHKDKSNKENELNKESNYNEKYYESFSKTNSLKESSDWGIPKISENEENEYSISSKKSEENFKNDDYLYFFNELANTEE